MTDTRKGGWWASRNGEFYNVGPLETREQALKEAASEFEGDAFYIVEAGLHEIKLSATAVIERQYFEDEDLWYDGDGADRCAGSEAADAELQQLLDGWLSKHISTFRSPTAFAWSRNEEMIPAGAVSGEISA
ncbi:hypothetical protein [Novosphingobium sp.]|uniref:hypothetical protein n=1 Tax=Novosphingobium sp. TaxID=1874826 RepID=UPI0028AB0819|nr:hypothetical protein [Novosphingobium sp.]